MRLLYYTTSFYAHHGGSIQSRELYRNLKNREKISALDIFPKDNVKHGVANKSLIGRLRKVIKNNGLIQAILFYRRNQFYLRALFQKISDFKPDVLLIQIDSNFLQVKYIKKRFPELKICTQINGSPFDEQFEKIVFKKKFIELQRKIYTIADLNIFISDYSKKKIMGKAICDSRDVVIHNGTDVQKFFPLGNKKEIRIKLGFGPKDFLIGYVGTLDYHKRLDILIHAFGTFLKKRKDSVLVIIGDGPSIRKLQNIVQTLHLEKNVFFTGWIFHDQINEYINCFDLAIHHYAKPYMNPLKIFEYLAAGVPVIAPDISSIREIFHDKRDLLITSGSSKDINKKLDYLYKNPNKRKELSHEERTFNQLKEKFTWEKYSINILKNLERKCQYSETDRQT